jgi:hypothetical protein
MSMSGEGLTFFLRPHPGPSPEERGDSLLLIHRASQVQYLFNWFVCELAVPPSGARGVGGLINCTAQD